MFAAGLDGMESGGGEPLDAALAAAATDHDLVGRAVELEQMRVALDAEALVVFG